MPRRGTKRVSTWQPRGLYAKFWLIALLCLSLASTTNAYSASSKKRWTEDNSPWAYETSETYTFVKDPSETFRMQWEMYEGSLALTQMAIVWLEVSTKTSGSKTSHTDWTDTVQIKLDTGSFRSVEMIRIRRIWQLESKGLALKVYDDEAGTEIKNNFANMEVKNTRFKNKSEWFVGDIVPFERCAYIVNMNSDGTNKFYNFMRLQTAVRWDPILKEKKVVTQIDHTSDEYTVPLNADKDLPMRHIEIGYWPLKGSFFYFQRGRIYFKHDPNADMQDTCDPKTLTDNDASWNRCDNSARKDPCARDTPLFLNNTLGVTTTLVHKDYKVSTNSDDENHAVTFEIVFDSIFVVFTNQNKIIYRVGGDNVYDMIVSKFYQQNDVSYYDFGKYNDGTQTSTKTIGNLAIESICSMDFYGLFVQVKNAKKVIRLELPVKAVDPAAASPLIKGGQEYDITKKNADGSSNEDGVYDIDKTIYFEDDTHGGDYKFHLLQTKGYYGRHRPCYMIQDNAVNQMYRLTTNKDKAGYFADVDLAGEGSTDIATATDKRNVIDLYTRDWHEGTIKQGPQLMRFHLFTHMPGLPTQLALGSLDYDQIQAFVYDLRARKVWGKFALTSAGDGTLDAAAGEECDPRLTPPTDYKYDNNESTDTTNARAYPDADDTPVGRAQPGKRVTWVPADTVKDESGDTSRPAQFMAAGYYTCESQAFLAPYPGCGDGVPSNGPPATGGINAVILKSNQRNGAGSDEECDDGGQEDASVLYGGACSTNCKIILDGYECLQWGKVCTPKCGNGHVEGTWVSTTVLGVVQPKTWTPEKDASGADREECDLGINTLNFADAATGAEYSGRTGQTGYNSPDDYASISASDTDYNRKYACSKDCKLIEKKFTANAVVLTKTDFPILPKKWNCKISETATISAVPNNPLREVFKQECTYLCGNKFLDIVIPAGESYAKEQCDIGDWAFHKLTADAGYSKNTATYASPTWAAKTPTEVKDWVDDQSSPKVNSLLSLGCTADCMTYRDAGVAFVYDASTYKSKGTDRCGDGIMDGPITLTKSDASTILIRAAAQKTCAKDAATSTFITETCQITGYTPYWEQEYSARMTDEECDNGGDVDHGCDRLCQIVTDWECHHYYHHIVGVELPYFTSICQETAYKTLSRRLSADDFDEKGHRRLHYWERRSYALVLPSNIHSMRPSKSTIYLEPKKGLNGQLRIMETSACLLCNAFTLGYERTLIGNPDYWYYNVRAETTSPATTDTEAKLDIAANVLKGKQRNTFGPYMVVNKDLTTIEIWGFTTAAGDKTFKLWWTSTAEASVQYLGAHEFHWFPHASLLMAKIGDGSSYRFFRLDKDFRATSPNQALKEMTSWIDSPQFRLFNIGGRTMVQPRFWKKMAYFYLSSHDDSIVAKLVAYQWNDLTLEFEKKCSEDIGAESSLQALYHKFSFVSVGDDGVILSQANTGTFKVYKCDPSTGNMSNAAVTISHASGAETGDQGQTGSTTITANKLILQQSREDPDSYTLGTFPDIYGIHGDGYIQKFTWSASTLSNTTPSITVPISMKITMSPEHFDIGKLQLGVLQPVQCAGKATTTTLVTEAAIQFYNFATKKWLCRPMTAIKSLMEVSTTIFWNHATAPPTGYADYTMANHK